MAGGLTASLLLVVLAVFPMDRTSTAVWFALFGFAVAFTPILTAHGKSLFPPQLTGRGITLMNIGTMGGAFLSQSITGLLMDAAGARPRGSICQRATVSSSPPWPAGCFLSLAFYTRAIDPHPSRHATSA